MLEISGLSVGYNGIEVLHDVALTVGQGDMVALIGPNGAGKSTLLNAISGLIKPTKGHIKFAGQNVAGVAAFRISRLGLLQVPEGRQILGDLTVLENLQLGVTALGGRAASAGVRAIFELFPILGERRTQRAGSLSGGQQQMLAIGRALMGAPRLLLLDEPSLGLAPAIVTQVMATLRKLNQQGLTILLVEQNARQALRSTGRAYVLEQGMIVKEGESAALASDAAVIEHYLGQTSGKPAKPAVQS